MKRSRKGKGDLPRGVRRVGKGFQAWAMLDGRRAYSRTVYSAEAAGKIAEAMRQGARGIEDAAWSLEDAMQAVLDDTPNAGTRDHYEEKFERIKRHIPGRSVLAGIAKEHVTLMRDAMAREVSNATVNRHLSALRKVFSFGIAKGWCEQNPASTKLTPFLKERRQEMDWFHEGEFRALLGRVLKMQERFPAAQKHADWMAVMAMTGLRRSELARSRVRDWNLETCTVFVAGKSQNRTVPFSEGLRPTIERLVAAPHGEHLATPKAETISGTFRTWAQRLKEPRLHPHALRHTFATSLVRAGNDVETVRHLMGHASIEQTMRYFHVCGVAARNAVAGLQLLPPAPRSADDDAREPPPAEERGAR